MDSKNVCSRSPTKISIGTRYIVLKQIYVLSLGTNRCCTSCSFEELHRSQ